MLTRALYSTDQLKPKSHSLDIEGCYYLVVSFGMSILECKQEDVFHAVREYAADRCLLQYIIQAYNCIINTG